MATDEKHPTMQAWQTAAGGVTTTLEASLRLNASVAAPSASSLARDEVLIEVISAALNPADYKVAEMGLASKLVFRSGPYQPGMDYCGRVVAAHASVAAAHPDIAQPGTLVFGAIPNAPTPPKHGTLSQFTIATADRCVPVPVGIFPDDAACVGIAGLSALGSLEQGGVVPGSKVLVNGGSGGVGTFTIQIAKALGAAHVTATCSAANADLCRSLGADEVLDYRTVDVIEELKAGGRAFDVAVDNVGDPALKLYENSAFFLKDDGCYVQVGASMSVAGIRSLVGRALTPRWLGGGERKFKFFQGQMRPEGLGKVGTWMAEGKVKPIIDQAFEFNDVPQAFQRLRTGRAKGKVIVHVGK
ncbi:alcohol dehydrogenase [Lasiodiplodia theobromae]|uniref:alcohol dehydrogenase n=1 Tax=Lasiodiplodia theobromae TaxID=45133 RepID=UPI0015C3BD47|nr:alcohol dehydrogenase [Lasiodiplodia theobromae]KAF4538582.1 alcohol dehydrogenase [Lasiodiplodia theobromae]